MRLILGGAVMAQLLLITYLGDRAYEDVLRAVSFGAGVEEGVISIRSHVDKTKTFLGPLLWYRLAAPVGISGIKAFNLGAFVALFVVQHAIGRRLYDRRVILLALFLTAFYTGTLRNVAAGEPDDMMASLLFAAGTLLWLDTRSAAAAGLAMGCAFLFKFWALIFFVGFALFLLVRHDWRRVGAASAVFALPFLCISLVDGGTAVAGFFATAQLVHRQSTWTIIALRLVVTGILPAFLMAGWATLRSPNLGNVLAFTVPAPYLLYILVMRDAHAVTFVMMLCLVFWSFPIAELLLGWQPLASRPWLGRVALAVYLIGAPANAWLNLWRDTRAFRIIPGCGAMAVLPSSPHMPERCALPRSL